MRRLRTRPPPSPLSTVCYLHDPDTDAGEDSGENDPVLDSLAEDHGAERPGISGGDVDVSVEDEQEEPGGEEYARKENMGSDDGLGDSKKEVCDGDGVEGSLESTCSDKVDDESLVVAHPSEDQDAEAARRSDQAEAGSEKRHPPKVLDFGNGVRIRVTRFGYSEVGSCYESLLSTYPTDPPTPPSSSSDLPPNTTRSITPPIKLYVALLDALVDGACYLDLRSFLSTKGHLLVNITSLSTIPPGRDPAPPDRKRQKRHHSNIQYGPHELFARHTTLHRVRVLGMDPWKVAAKDHMEEYRANMEARLALDDLGWVRTREDVGIALGCVAIGCYAMTCCEISRFADFRDEVLLEEGKDEVLFVPGLQVDWVGVKRYLGLVDQTLR